MRLLITGASGFVGRAIVRNCVANGHDVRALVRRDDHEFNSPVEVVRTGDLTREDVSPDALEGCDVVVNCAARVHVTRETEADPEAAYRAANCDLPVRLLNQAADCGVSRFVQLSSVAAVTSVTPPGRPVDDSAEPRPRSPYGRSKLEADLRLAEVGRERGIAVVSLRPPTVFGPGVGAYFRMLMRCAKFGLPLPLGSVRNRRSFIFSENLADAVVTAAGASGEGTFIVTDSPPISTGQLYRSLLRLLGRPAFVPPVPAVLVRRASQFVLGDRVESLIGDSAFDGSRFRETFDWSPPVSFERALEITVGGSS